MKKNRLAVLASLALLAPLAGAGPAQAAVSPSIDITTTKARAYGTRINPVDLGLEPGKAIIFRAVFRARATVTCPAGEEWRIYVADTWAHTDPTVQLTCTGSPQTVTTHVAPAPTTRGRYPEHPLTIYLLDSEWTQVAQDTQLVNVRVFARPRP